MTDFSFQDPAELEDLPDLEDLTSDDLAAAALACAQRLSPLFAGFATRSDPQDYTDLLADMWRIVGQDAHEEAINDLDARLAAFPEVACDDSYLMDYEAGCVLGVGYAALRVLDGGGPGAAAECFETALELLGGLGEELGNEELLVVPEAREQHQVVTRIRAGESPTLESALASGATEALRQAIPELVARSRARQEEYLASLDSSTRSTVTEPPRALVGPASVLGCPVSGGRHEALRTAEQALQVAGCVFDGVVVAVPQGAETDRFGAAPHTRILQASTLLEALENAHRAGLETVTAWFHHKVLGQVQATAVSTPGTCMLQVSVEGFLLRRALNAPGRTDQARAERALSAVEDMVAVLGQHLGAPYCSLGSEAPSPTPDELRAGATSVAGLPLPWAWWLPLKGERALSTEETLSLQATAALGVQAAGDGLLVQTWDVRTGREAPQTDNDVLTQVLRARPQVGR